MLVRTIGFLLVYSQCFLSEFIIDWKPFSISSCQKPSDFPVSTFECFSPFHDFDLNEKICLKPQFLVENFDFCFPTTEIPRIRDPENIFLCEDEEFLGEFCNITNDPCRMAEICQNGGTCSKLSDSSTKSYFCRCPPFVFGDDCEIDLRICKDDTCWHDGNCIEIKQSTNSTGDSTHACQCKNGYDGLHCELIRDMCTGIVCENGGYCRSSYLEWSCQCSDPSSYSGRFCERKSSQLLTKQILSKSFASVAIIAIVLVFLFVIVMDILKYCFGIDPVDFERRFIRSKLDEIISDRQKKKLHYVE